MQSKGKANSKADIQHDHLTALWNKEAGEELLDSCIRTAKAQSTSFLAVLLDINDLDTINKRCGHQEGDRILQRVAEKIRSSLQTGDFAIRLGGDEFLLVFQQLSKKEVRNLLDQILNELEEESREFPYTMGFCFGITQIMADMELSVKKSLCVQMMKCICQNAAIIWSSQEKPLRCALTMKVRRCASFPMIRICC